MDLDKIMPVYDFAARYERWINSSPAKTFDALKHIDFCDSWIIRVLFFLRGLNVKHFNPYYSPHFILLSENKPNEVVFGLVARPWANEITKSEKESFLSLNDSSAAKITWNFTFQEANGGTLATTETRILCSDPKSLKKFRIYWFFVRPFSGIIRKEMLKMLANKN